MKRQYESPSTEAVRFAEEPKRGFVFFSSYMKGEKIVTGADRLMADVAESGAEASTNKIFPIRREVNSFFKFLF